MADAPAIALQDSKGRKPFAALHRFTAATGRTAMRQDSRAEVIKRAARHLGRVLFVEYFYLTLVVVSLAVLLVPPLIAPFRGSARTSANTCSRLLSREAHRWRFLTRIASANPC
jgi:hypothetical protein